MEITSKMVQDLRSETGLGMMDCKKALVECGGDMGKAVEHLRKKGMKVAENRSGRDTSQGAVEAYIHTGGKIGVLLEMLCETDFVARTDGFKDLCHDIALHIAAADPHYLNREDVPADILDREKDIFATQCKEEGKPEKVIPKIVEGKLERFYESVCLIDQPFVKDPDKKISDVIAGKMAETGENIRIGRFTRYVLGQ